jgi:hypothetical protein
MNEIIEALRMKNEAPHSRVSFRSPVIELKFYNRPRQMVEENSFNGPSFDYKEVGKIENEKMVSGEIKSDAHRQSLIEKARANAISHKAELFVFETNSKYGQFAGPAIIHESYK